MSALPSPWRVTLVHDKTGNTQFLVQQHTASEVIASPEWCWDQYGVSSFLQVLMLVDEGAGDDTRVTTARLIAAAPEMRDLLVECLARSPERTSDWRSRVEALLARVKS